MSARQFDYLLNAFEEALQSDDPARYGYGEKRRKLLEYVHGLEQSRYVSSDARLEEAERIILTLTMDHNSSPNYVRGFDMAHEYFGKYRDDPRPGISNGG